MSVLLFRLNDVPEDEADEVRALLAERRFEFYETHAGRWGISVAALWLKDAEDLPAARKLIDDYQAQRGRRVREEYEALRRAGQTDTFLARMRRQPLLAAAYLAAVFLVLYLSLMPFLNWR